MYEAKTAENTNFWIFWSITLLICHLFKSQQTLFSWIRGQNVQKLQILLFSASYIASILKFVEEIRKNSWNTPFFYLICQIYVVVDQNVSTKIETSLREVHFKKTRTFLKRCQEPASANSTADLWTTLAGGVYMRPFCITFQEIMPM